MDPMTPTVMDRATLAAFVDGALSPEDSARVVLHLADVPGDAAFVDALAESNALIAEAYGAPLHEPVPERIRAAIFSQPAAPAHRLARAGGRLRKLLTPRAGWTAIAASVALAAALGFVALGPRAPREVQITLSAATEEALRDALETRVGGAAPTPRDAPRITLIATFLDRQGAPCREYEIVDTAGGAITQGLVCRRGDGDWIPEIEVANRVADPQDRGDAFVPAAGPASGALDDALERIGAGMVLSPAEEQALIARGWTR